jgi:proline iminopeptidase
MHGGPGADHSTMLPLLPLSSSHALILYDHRCNGRSKGADIATMTWDNLVEDAEAIRNHLQLEKWAVVGHSFGGMVALAYAIRHSGRISKMVLLDTAADASWVHKRTPAVLAERGFKKKTLAMAERFYSGLIGPREFKWSMLKLARAYYGHPRMAFMVKQALQALRIHASASAFIQGTRYLIAGWNVTTQLGRVSCPTLIVAGSEDFLFPPEQQRELQRRIDGARLEIVSGAGHNAHMERPREVVRLIAEFLGENNALGAGR